MFGQFGHFYRFAKEKLPYPIERYTNETRRLLGVLETRFTRRSVFSRRRILDCRHRHVSVGGMFRLGLQRE